MFDYSKVDEAIRRIVDAVDPRTIIMFGSVARHEAKDHSDLDFLVIFDEVEDWKRTYASIARQFIGCKLPFDLFVLSRDEYNGQRTGGIHSCMRWRPQVWWSTRWDASLIVNSIGFWPIEFTRNHRPGADSAPFHRDGVRSQLGLQVVSSHSVRQFLLGPC